MNKNFSTLNNTVQNIPNNFDYETYIKITKNKSLNNVYLAYNHYIKVGQHNQNIYKSFWREIYGIPNDFNEYVYKLYVKTHYNVNIPITDSKELYSFYSKIGNTIYPINDKYYRIFYNIPDNFDPIIYAIVYPEAYNIDNNKIYEFYKNNKEKCPLDEIYTTTHNNTYNFKNTEEIKKINDNKFTSEYYDSIVLLDNNIKFSYKAFNKRYNLNLDETKSINLYNNNKNKYPLDEFYYKILYCIPSTLNQKYIDVFKKLYNYDDLYNINDMYEYYYNSQYNMFEDNEYKDESFYFIKKYIDNELFINDTIFLYDFSKNRITLRAIYDIYNNQIPNTFSISFIKTYEYLNNYSDFIDTDIIKKNFFLLEPFVKEYFQNNTNLKNKNYLIYNTFYYGNINIENIFLNLEKWHKFYDLYSKIDYFTHMLCKNKPQENNDIIEYAFVLMDNYSHNYVSLFQNICQLKYNYKFTIITKQSIMDSDEFKKYFEIINKSYNINILIYNENFSFNDFNNLLYSVNFWEIFKANYVVLLNSLAIIKKIQSILLVIINLLDLLITMANMEIY